jgi:hypothetical protein
VVLNSFAAKALTGSWRRSTPRYELLASITSDLTKLGPLIDPEAVRELRGSRTEGGLTVEIKTIEHGWRSRA